MFSLYIWVCPDMLAVFYSKIEKMRGQKKNSLWEPVLVNTDREIVTDGKTGSWQQHTGKK